VTVLAEIAALLTLVGLLQCFMGLAAVRRFVRTDTGEPASASASRPPVTILRPLCGNEPLLEEALLSCFCQNYPEFQIVFGVHTPNDPALEVVERLRQRFPECDMAVVIDSRTYGPNRKVSNLINMLPAARHDILVISDSDLHLPADYLDDLVGVLMIPGTGLVTSLYIGVPSAPDNLIGALGSTQISHHFLPGVLVSCAMGRQDCLGSTAMFRRDTLERIGGFVPLVQLLAEDNVLGQRVRKLGLSIRLGNRVPAATVPERSLRPLWQHELRWTRTIRELEPALLLASIMQYPLFWAGLALALTGGAQWAFILFLAAWAVRHGCARAIDRGLKNRIGRPAGSTPSWLFPLRDIMSVIEIAASFCIDEVIWRGHRLGATGVVTAPVDGQSG